MNPAWSYIWPPLAAAMLVGAISGLIAFRQRPRRNMKLAVGLIASLALAGVWHGPLGAADRFTSQIERDVRATLVNNEIPEVTGHLQHHPLSRRVLLSGPADDFQRSELIRIISRLPGVSTASWSGRTGGLPLIGEACIIALAGFLTGLLLAYLIELRRRYNSQWKW